MTFPLLLRLARRHVSRRLLQSVLFVVGVALGVAMVIAIDLANGSASRAFALSTETVAGKATHQVLGGPSGLPTDVYTQLRVDLGLTAAAPIVEDYVRASSLNDRVLHLLGVDPFSEPPFRSYLSSVNVEGQTASAAEALTAFITQPNTVLISKPLADHYHVRPGDSLELRVRDGTTSVKVVGLLLPTDSLSQQALENLLLTDIATAQELVGRPGVITRIDLILPSGYDTSKISALLPPGATLTTPQAQSGAIAQMTAAFELNLQALSLLALIVGVFLIYNTVTFSVIQRRPQIGVLRALGATRRQIFAMILSEALLLGAIGTIIGLGLGIIFGRGAVGLVAQTISDLYFTVNVQGVAVDPFTLVKGAAIGIVASLAASALPSYEATHTPPAGALRRSEVEQGARRLVPRITAAAVAMLIVGALLLTLPTRSLIVSFTSLFFFIVGGACFTPVVLLAVMRIATPITDRLFGIIGTMAPRAVSRALSRTSVAVAALTVAISVIVGVGVMIGSFRGTVEDWLNNTLGADIYISPPNLVASRATGSVDPAAADRVRAIDGVDHLTVGRNVTVTAPDFPDLPPVNLASADGEVTSGQRRFAWLNVPLADYWTALTGGKLMVSEPFAYRRGITPEHNKLTLLTDRGPQTFEVAGVYYDYATDQGTVFMADNVYRQYYDDKAISSIAVFLKPGVDPAAVLDTIRNQALTGTNLLAQSNVSLRSGVFTVFDRAFSITIALRLLATVVAFIGILSALMALQLEGTRQYGTMRAVGMTGGQLWRFTLVQTGLMGLVAGLLALPIGFVLALVLVYVINVRSFGWTMQLLLQPNEFVLAFVVAVVAALAAGIYPAQRLSRTVPAQALRSE